MDVLAEIVSHHGVAFTAAEASRHGVDSVALARGVRSRRLVRLGTGVYRRREDTPPPHEEFRALALAQARRHPRAALSHQSALVCWGLRTLSFEPGVVDLVRPEAEGRRSGRGVRVHRWPGDEHVLVRDGIRVVEPAVAVVQVARRDGATAGVVAADDLLARHPDSGRAALDRAVLAAGRVPGIGRARRAVSLADGRSESAGESAVRCILAHAGMVATPQVLIALRGKVIARVDLLIEGRVVVEFDGAVKYAAADGRDALVREKRREDAIREAGHEVLRVTWADLGDPHGLVGRVRSLLERR